MVAKRPHVASIEQAEGGFSLLEILVAISLVSVAFVGVLSTYTTSLAIQKDIDQRSKAVFVAQQVLEETATIPYEELTSGSIVDIYDDEFSGDLIITRTVQDMADSEIAAHWTRLPDPDPSSAYKLVTVSVDWGGYDPGTGQENWENVTFHWIRVQRENTVDFQEKPFSQAP